MIYAMGDFAEDVIGKKMWIRPTILGGIVINGYYWDVADKICVCVCTIWIAVKLLMIAGDGLGVFDQWNSCEIYYRKGIGSSGWSKTLWNCKGFWVWCISKHLYRSFRTSSSEVWWAGGSRTDRDVFIDLHWQLNQKWGWLLIMRIPAIWFALLYIFLSWNN